MYLLIPSTERNGPKKVDAVSEAWRTVRQSWSMETRYVARSENVCMPFLESELFRPEVRADVAGYLEPSERSRRDVRLPSTRIDRFTIVGSPYTSLPFDSVGTGGNHATSW